MVYRFINYKGFNPIAKSGIAQTQSSFEIVKKIVEIESFCISQLN